MMFALQSSMCDLMLEMSAKVAEIASVEYFVVFQTQYEKKVGGNKQLCELFQEEFYQSAPDVDEQFKQNNFKKSREQERHKFIDVHVVTNSEKRKRKTEEKTTTEPQTKKVLYSTPLKVESGMEFDFNLSKILAQQSQDFEANQESPENLEIPSDEEEHCGASAKPELFEEQFGLRMERQAEADQVLSVCQKKDLIVPGSEDVNQNKPEIFPGKKRTKSLVYHWCKHNGYCYTEEAHSAKFTTMKHYSFRCKVRGPNIGCCTGRLKVSRKNGTVIHSKPHDLCQLNPLNGKMEHLIQATHIEKLEEQLEGSKFFANMENQAEAEMEPKSHDTGLSMITQHSHGSEPKYQDRNKPQLTLSSTDKVHHNCTFEGFRYREENYTAKHTTTKTHSFYCIKRPKGCSGRLSVARGTGNVVGLQPHTCQRPPIVVQF